MLSGVKTFSNYVYIAVVKIIRHGITYHCCIPNYESCPTIRERHAQNILFRVSNCSFIRFCCIRLF
jgi:hypothetical protein